MKMFLTAVIGIFSLTASAQYYYKDIIGTKESADLINAYRKNNVRTVQLNSFTVDNTPLDNLLIQQEFQPEQGSLRTITRSDYTNPSYLTTYVDDAGRVVKTIDSSAGIINTSIYTYNKAGGLSSIVTTYGDSLTALKTDEHLWQYDTQNRISKLLRIKNKVDTSVITFKLDEAGNVVEEQEARRSIKEEPYYYYYDAQNRLTDIVRYNKKAARLMPEQMFEYSTRNQIVQRITIPQNSTEYLIWRYQFDDRGLKTKEHIYNKQKELTGKVEYRYTFGQ